MLSNGRLSNFLGGHRKQVNTSSFFSLSSIVRADLYIQSTELEMIGGIVCVGAISGCLVYYMIIRRSGMPRSARFLSAFLALWLISGLHVDRSDPVISRLIVFTINTGLLLWQVNLFTLISFRAYVSFQRRHRS